MTSPLRSFATAAAFMLVASGLFAPSASGTLFPTSDPQPVDGAQDCGSSDPAAAALTDGGYVVVWTNGVVLQMRELDANGRPVGSATVVASGNPLAPEVVALPDGGFAIVWFDRTRQRILARRSSASGQLASEVELGGAGPERGEGFGGLDAAVNPQGNLRVGWVSGAGAYLRELRVNGTLVPATFPYEVEVYGGVTGVSPALFDPAVVIGSDGATRMFFVLAGIILGPYSEVGGVYGFRVPALDYSVPKAEIEVGAYGSQLAAATQPDGSYLLTWVDGNAPSNPVQTAHFSADDEQGDVMILDASEEGTGVPAVAAVAGSYVVSWEQLPDADEPERKRVVAQALAATGTPQGPVFAVADSNSWGQVLPTVAFASNGTGTVVWQEVQDPEIINVVCPGEMIRARSFELACEDGFCVGDGRFVLTLDYADPARGIAGTAHGVGLTGDSGYFWFTAPDNVEVMVKVLDGRAINGHFWVFYGSLTDIGFTLVVSDTETGHVARFTSAAGQMASQGITDALPAPTITASSQAGEATWRAFTNATLVRDALPAPGTETVGTPGRIISKVASGVESTQSYGSTSSDPSPSAAGPCSPPELPVVPRSGLCLAGKRFEVETSWVDFDGLLGFGQGVPLGDDSGYFWFFSPENIELVVKVLDGRAINGRFWVFYGALSSVQYDVVVRHVLPDEGGAIGTATFHNPSGQLASVADISTLTPPDPASCVCTASVQPVCGTDGVTYPDACGACAAWVTVAHLGPCTP